MRFDKKNKLALAVELSDFSVYDSQGIAEAIAAELKERYDDACAGDSRLVAHLYALTDLEFTHILGTFPLVPEETKAAALTAFREVAVGG